MPRSLILAPRALRELEAINRWLRQPGAGRVARRRLEAIRVAIIGLREHPSRHPVGEHPSRRELAGNGGYRVVYRVTPDTGRDETAGDVTVLRVFGPGQSRDPL